MRIPPPAGTGARKSLTCSPSLRTLRFAILGVAAAFLIPALAIGASAADRAAITGGTAWTSIPHDVAGGFTSVSFPDADNGWACGTGGMILRTADAGLTWTAQDAGSETLTDVVMTDALSGWAVGEGGATLHTTDGGLTWTPQSSDVTSDLSSVAAADAQHAIIAGPAGPKYTSTAGASWTTASVAPELPVTGLSMPDANNAWAVTERTSGTSVIWYSADGGATWAPQSTGVTVTLRDVYFIDARTGYAAGDAGVVLRTLNGGASWLRCPTPTTEDLSGIRFLDSSTGWAVGRNGTLLRSVDAGRTWALGISGTTHSLTAIAIAGSSSGWVVGAGGTMLHNEIQTPLAKIAGGILGESAINGLSGLGLFETAAGVLPTAPAIVYAKATTGATAYIDWVPSDDVEPAGYYRVWRSANGVDYSVIGTTTGVFDCSYMDAGLASSTRYWYAVSTVDSRGESPLSVATTQTETLTLRPERPTGVTATGLGGAVFVEWEASTDPAILYYVVRAPASLSATTTTLTVVPTTLTGYFDFSVNPGEPYWYSVKAVDASGSISATSVEAAARVLVVLPNQDAGTHTWGNGVSTCMCHSTHVGGGTDKLMRFPGYSSQTMCLTCHTPDSANTDFVDPLAVSKHAEGATPTVEEPFTCLTCHVPIYEFDQPPANLMRVNGYSPCVETTDTPAGNGFCYKCHGTGSVLPMGDLTVFEGSAHATITPPAGGADITCDACHESHSSRNTSLLKYKGFMVCMQCHTASSSEPTRTDIYSLLTFNEGANTKHPVLPQDQATGAQMACQNCHNTHALTTDLPLVEPHDPTPTGTWPDPVTNEKGFCFECHDGDPLPTAGETLPWADPVLGVGGATTTTDIQSMYTNNVHGFGQRSEGTTTTAYLRADMGYVYGDVLECRACHDPHGTANDMAIRSDIASVGGTMTVDGLLVAGSGGVRDYRFLCSACHSWSSATHDSRAETSTVSFPMDCSGCHTHALGAVLDGGF